MMLGRLPIRSSTLPWLQAPGLLGTLIGKFGPPSRTSQAQSSAYPFTRLRSDGIWQLDHEVPMDAVSPVSM